jgi:glycosyltransferase involved in cell wall biosynthesis
LIPTVRFFGPLSESSGYGNAVKNFAIAFSKSNIRTKYHFSDGTKKKYANIMSELDDYAGRTNIDFYLHCPPWTRHKSKANYKIGYFYWEADKLPSGWNRSINGVDELWVPCELVKEACMKSRFRGRILVVPTPNDPWEHDERVIIPSPVSEDYAVSDNVFKFYSVFQWHERKGYRELLNAYYKTFKKTDNVLLVLKVNPLNVSGNTREKIKSDIHKIKIKLNKAYYPPVFLMTKIIPTESLQAIHNTCDCYVAPHHGEGWGMPIHNAMHAGNQIITTRFGGVTEFLGDNSAHIIKHQMGPVANMDWSPLYSRSQNWAYPSISHLGKLMRDVYLNHGRYKDKSERARIIAESMTTDQLSKIIESEINKIGKSR